jgi:hypothetical protein
MDESVHQSCEPLLPELFPFSQSIMLKIERSQATTDTLDRLMRMNGLSDISGHLDLVQLVVDRSWLQQEAQVLGSVLENHLLDGDMPSSGGADRSTSSDMSTSIRLLLLRNW